MNLNKNAIICVCITWLLTSFFSCKNSVSSGGLTPEEALAAFEITEGFQVELIANEPLMADPVAMEIDEYGRMYVVEMHGYPLDKEGSGSIKLLNDTDGDGIMDESVTFVDGLCLPNGIMRWKAGILVTDAPYVLYFEDADGDGKADVRDTILTGFALSNPQHKVNTPIYGLDNWIYLANEPITAAKIYTEEFGDPGREIRYPKFADSPILPVNANGRRVRLRPGRKGLEMLSAETQFSNAQDTWGRHFLGNNTNHIVHEVIQAKYLTRNKHLETPSAIQTISTYGMPAEVYPITESPEHQIFTSIGMFTSACGVTLYGGAIFPEIFDQVAFVAEPVSNIVHAARLEEDGASFKARRLYEKKEFLASKDSWFRPVNHYVGPDGALYVVDYYRRYIEHPEWMGEDVVNSGALYDGKDKGRIYRIVPVGTGAADWTTGLKLGDAENIALVKYLNHPNAWYRRTAQRLLVDRQDKTTVDEIRKMALTDRAAYGRLHAAWTLEGLNALTTEVVIAMLNDATAGIRENGIRLAETLLKNHPELMQSLLALKDDRDAHVSFQLLCTLGDYDAKEVVQARAQLLFDHIDNEWMHVAALSAYEPDYNQLISRAIRQFHKGGKASSQFIQRATSMFASQGSTSQIKNMINQALNVKDDGQGVWQSAILNGITKGKAVANFESEEFDEERSALLWATFNHGYPAIRSASLELLKQTGLPLGKATQDAVEYSLATIKNNQAAIEKRLHAITFLSIKNAADYQQLFYALLAPQEPLELQKAALKVLGETGGLDIAYHLRDHWKAFTPQFRDAAIAIFLSGNERTIVLIEALEQGVIDPSSVDFYRQIYLMTLANEELRTRTRKVFADESKDEGRKKVIDDYQEALTSKGDMDRGALVFEKQCSACHQMGGALGVDYGPDLGSVRNWRAETIMTNILDPSLSIADGYDLWEIQLLNGDSKRGIIASETPNTIALSIYGGQPEVISRKDITSMRALGVTIMPAGLEGVITKQDMADLLAFIKKIE